MGSHAGPSRPAIPSLPACYSRVPGLKRRRRVSHALIRPRAGTAGGTTSADVDQGLGHESLSLDQLNQTVNKLLHCARMAWWSAGRPKIPSFAECARNLGVFRCHLPRVARTCEQGPSRSSWRDPSAVSCCHVVEDL